MSTGTSSESSSLGVLVMRVQVDDITEGHYDVIKNVIDRSDRTMIVIGLSPCKCTLNNPLDFDTRRRMILDYFPDVIVGYIEDVYSNEVWSNKLDGLIRAKSKQSDDVTLYGSRDSFIKHYRGAYDTETIQQRVHISGTQIRKGLALRSRNTKDFRAGAIWYAMNQYPSALPTVDIAIIDGNNDILLGRKLGENGGHRLVGGFVQPGERFEDAAVRELKEETGIVAKDLDHIGSFVIDDWRYRNEASKITTTLYVVRDWDGRIQPDDDIDELAWFPLNKELLEIMVPEHKEMIETLLNI